MSDGSPFVRIRRFSNSFCSLKPLPGGKGSIAHGFVLVSNLGTLLSLQTLRSRDGESAFNRIYYQGGERTMLERCVLLRPLLLARLRDLLNTVGFP